MRNKIKKAVRISFILLLFFFTLLLIIDNLRISRAWLNVNNPINSDVYVCEGWLSPDYYDTLTNILKKNKKEILVTGSKLPKSVTLYQNGYLIIKNIFKEYSDHINIKIGLSGSAVDDIFTNTKIFLNDSLLYEQFLKKKTTIFEINEYAPNIDSIVIEFTNDFSGKYEDRNLTLEELYINNNPISLHSEDIWLNFKDIYVNSSAKSFAEISANILYSNGLKRDRINYIASSKSGISKTFNAANDAVKWLKANGYNSADIITADYHSRRTYISYKKADPNFKIGIITLPDKSHRSILNSKLRTLKELSGCLFIRITPKFILNKKP
jgi:hypothetical protein